MKNVLITGANGFIGSNLVKECLNKGIHVYALVRKKEGISFEHPNLSLVEVDYSQYKNIPKIVPHVNYDALFHLAWKGYEKYANDPTIQLENVVAAAELAASAVSLHCQRFIFIGSFHEYQKNQNNLYNESRFCSVYGATKHSAGRLCEIIAHNNGMEYIKVVLPHVFGVGDHSWKTANILIQKFIRNEVPSLIKGENIYDWIYVDDVVRGLVILGSQGEPFNSYYLGNASPGTFRNLIMNVKNVLAPEMTLFFGNYKDNAFIDYSMIQTNKLYHDTEFRIQSNFKENILKTAEWVKTLSSS